MVTVQFVKEEKSMTVSDNKIQAKEIGSFFKRVRRISAEPGKTLATNVLENPDRAMEISSNIATAAATKDPKAALSSLPEAMHFYHTGKGLYLRKFVWFYTIFLDQKAGNYTHLHH